MTYNILNMSEDHITVKNLLGKKGTGTNLYQSLADADDVTKVLDGRSESFLHVAAEENGGGWRKVAQCRDL